MERRIPTREEVDSYLRDRRNWGRWGADDEVGAVNLITPEKRVAAARLVRSGRTVSLSRYIPKTPGPGNPVPAQHFMWTFEKGPFASGSGGSAIDFYGMAYHGIATTHLDALCHNWNQDGMWNGRDPSKEITFQGAKFGSVDRWGDGIITRGVLLDVPKFRGEPFVTQESPVHGWELEDVAKAQGVVLEPGDALAVYSGREAWQIANPDNPYGVGGAKMPRPGLHASCLAFIRDNDVSVLSWDMLDKFPKVYDIPSTVHGSVFAYGVALLDNCLLQPLAEACAEEGRYEFMLMIAPLKMRGGTGSTINPIAMF